MDNSMHNNHDAMPAGWRAIAARTAAMGFGMPSDADTGALLKTLAAGKPGGRLLELGTGTGLATACLLAGMDEAARLVTVDSDETVIAVAREHLGGDPRVRFITGDGLDFIRGQPPGSFDLIFADAWPGKYEGLDECLALLRPGGLWIGDDMLPQPNWPQGHPPRVDALVERLAADPALSLVRLAWGSGFVLAARR